MVIIVGNKESLYTVWVDDLNLVLALIHLWKEFSIEALGKKLPPETL